MFTIFSVSENKIIFKSDNESEFMDFVKSLVKENGDENFSILGIGDAIEYIDCSDYYTMLN